MSEKPIGVAIIGYGYMGEIRRRAVLAHPALRLAGIADVKPRPIDRMDGVAWTDSYDVLIDRDDVDAVFVCVPNRLIPEVACRALATRKHVFCEKPPGRTVADVVRMREAEAASGGRVLMFGFNHRFHPAMLEAKRVVDAGELGRVLYLKGTYGKPGGPGYGPSWRNDPAESGGGILLDQGIHMLDLFRYYGGEFRTVKACCAATLWKMPVEDNAFVVLAGEGGTHAVLHSSATLAKPTFRLEIGLTGGRLLIEGLLSKTGRYGPETLTVGRGGPEGNGRPAESRQAYGDDQSWAIEVANFARAIAAGGTPRQCSSLDALRAMELVHAAYADSGRAAK